MILAMKAREGPDTEEPAERISGDWPHFRRRDGYFHTSGIAGEVAGKNHPTPSVLSESSGKIRCGPHWRELSSEFKTVDEADTPGHPQLFRAVTLEFRLLTEDGATVDRSHDIQHGDVRIIQHFRLLTALVEIQCGTSPAVCS